MYTLRIILREAKDKKIITENPLQVTEPMGKESTTRDVFSDAELKALFPAGKLAEVWFSQSKGCLFMVLASTGIRSGEARALAWRQVLWGERALLVDRAVHKDGEIGPISEKKGGAKIVLLPSRTAAELKEWFEKTFWKEPEDIVFSGEVVKAKKESARGDEKALKKTWILIRTYDASIENLKGLIRGSLELAQQHEENAAKAIERAST